MPQIVWTSDVDGNATYFNRRWFEYTGTTPDEASADAWHAVVHPDDLPRVRAAMHAIREMKCDTLILDDGMQYLHLKHRLTLCGDANLRA